MPSEELPHTASSELTAHLSSVHVRFDRCCGGGGFGGGGGGRGDGGAGDGADGGWAGAIGGRAGGGEDGGLGKGGSGLGGGGRGGRGGGWTHAAGVAPVTLAERSLLSHASHSLHRCMSLHHLCRPHSACS